MQYLSEGTRAESRLRLLSNRLNSHAVTKLACQDQAVFVIPSMGGRILDFRAYGRGWLAEADPDNFDYPAPDGYLEYAGYLTGSLEALPRQLAVTVAAGRFVVRHRMQGDMIRFTAGKRSDRHSLSLYYCTNLLDLPPGKAVSFSQTMTFSRMAAGKGLQVP